MAPAQGPEMLALEQMLVTTRGVRVQPPGYCVKPSVALDIDDLVTGVAIVIGGVVGDRVLLLDRPTSQNTVLHGLGVEFTQAATAAVADPYSQLRVFLQVDDAAPGSAPVEPVGLAASVARSSAYQAIPIDLWNGVRQLTWLGLALRPDRRVVLFVERIATLAPSPTTSFIVAARWKGWDYTGQKETDRGDTFHAN